MSDSYAAYQEDVIDYVNLCELVKEIPDYDNMYNHMDKIKKYPYIHYKNGKYQINKKDYPEYCL